MDLELQREYEKYQVSEGFFQDREIEIQRENEVKEIEQSKKENREFLESVFSEVFLIVVAFLFIFGLVLFGPFRLFVFVFGLIYFFLKMIEDTLK